MFFRRNTRREGPKIPPLSGFRVLLSRVQAVFACFEFPDHLSVLLSCGPEIVLRMGFFIPFGFTHPQLLAFAS